MKLSLKPFSKGLRSLEAEPQVARRSERNSLFETRCPTRVSTKTNKKGKTTRSGGLSRELRVLRDALFYSFLVDFRRAKIKRGFRALRSAAQGNSARVLGPWPNESATALRENAPQGPFLVPQGSRKAGESFNIGCGACFNDPRGTSSQPRPTVQSVQSGSGIPSDH